MKKFTPLLLAGAVITALTLGVYASPPTQEHKGLAGNKVYEEHFDTQEAFNTFEVKDANDDGTTWQWNRNNKVASIMTTSGTKGNDDWLLTPEIQLEAGRVYQLSFRAWGSGDSEYYTERLAVGYGIGDNTAAYSTFLPTTTIRFDRRTFTNTITINRTGTYRIGFHCLSPASQYELNVDDIVLTDIASAAAPNMVQMLRATPAADGATRVTLSFQAPTQASDGSTLGALTSIEVYRDSMFIGSISSPKPGAILSFTDSAAHDGNNTYHVVACNEAGAGVPSAVTTYAGDDTPGAVSRVQLVDRGDSLVLSWRAPTRGANGRKIDPTHTKYNIYLYEDYNYTLYKGDVEGTTVTLPLVGGGQRETSLYVAAYNGAGEGSKTPSNAVLLGDPYQLPVMQDFHTSFMSNWLYNGWTDENGHYWWRENNGSSRPTYNSTGNGSVYYTLDGYYSCSFNTGKISLQGTVNPQLTFKTRKTGSEDASIEIRGITPDNKTVSLGSYAVQTTSYVEHKLSLSTLKDYSYVYIKFVGKSDDETSFGLDDINIVDATPHNLNARLAAPAHIVAGQENNAQVYITNMGTQAASNYTVRLYLNGELASEKAFTTELAANKADTVAMPFNLRPGLDSAKVYAVVDYPEDESTLDNTTATQTLRVLQPTTKATPAVEGLTATADNTGNHLQWAAVTATENHVTDDMESYPAFTLPGDGHYLEFEYNIGPWYNYDADQEYSLDIPNYTFPWEEEAFAYIVFNRDSLKTESSASAGTPSGSSLSIFKAHSGNQFLAAFSMKDDMAVGTHVSDWLISPELNGAAQDITFWVQTLSTSNGTATYQVCYSTTDSLHDSFTHVLVDTVVTYSGSVDWQEVKVSLPAGAKYFAIHHTTPININQILMLDDISYTTGNTAPTAYRVYRDGRLAATVNEPSYTDAEGGSHTYQVSAVYAVGESQLSAPASVTTGIRAVEAGKAKVQSYYSVDGKQLKAPTDGLNIVKMSDGTVKKVIINRH